MVRNSRSRPSRVPNPMSTEEKASLATDGRSTAQVWRDTHQAPPLPATGDIPKPGLMGRKTVHADGEVSYFTVDWVLHIPDHEYTKMLVRNFI
jgi:hypothetical protein